VVDVTVSFGDLDADIFSLDEIEWVVLGSALSTSLTINREGKVSVEYADYDFEPDGFDYDFGEGFVRFVENVKREFAERLLTKASGYESERLA
jgi:hypothetical protein